MEKEVLWEAGSKEQIYSHGGFNLVAMVWNLTISEWPALQLFQTLPPVCIKNSMLLSNLERNHYLHFIFDGSLLAGSYSL